MIVQSKEKCSWSGCWYGSDASFDGRQFCRDHFWQYTNNLLKKWRHGLPGLGEKEKRQLPSFLSQIISEATVLVSKAKFLSDDQRTQLLELSFAALEFYKRVQRNPRLEREVLVEISTIDAAKREITKTIDLSRKGACVQTTLTWVVGQELHVVLLNAKTKAQARVAWSSIGKIGLQILDNEDFWGLGESGPVRKKLTENSAPNSA